jgi:hypothetical protein
MKMGSIPRGFSNAKDVAAKVLRILVVSIFFSRVAKG